jgi:peroxiredoxin
LTAPKIPTLEIGDPVPSIVLPTQSGTRLSLHHPAVAGNPIVLLATRRLDAVAEAQLDILAAQHPRFAALGARLLAITGEGPAETARAAAAHGLRFPVLSDEPGHFLTVLGVPPAGAVSCRLLIVDHGLRVVGRLPCNGGDADTQAALGLCERLAQQRNAPAPVVTQQAPVLLVPQVFGPDLCRRLIDLWAEAEKQEDVASGYYATAGGQGAHPSTRRPTLKRRSDWLIPNGPVHDEITDLLSRRVAPELRKAFDFHAENFEQLRIGCYDATRGGYFRRHRDNVGPPEIRRRRFAMSLNLNDAYEGGEVHFPEYGPQLYRPPMGAALLFSCSVLHEAMEVRSGQRFVLLTFFFGAAPGPSAPPASAPA